jgi:phage FluMu protein Com
MQELRCVNCNKLMAKHHPLKLELQFTLEMMKEKHTLQNECLEMKCSRCGALNFIIFK